MTRNVSFDFFRGVMALMVCIGHFLPRSDPPVFFTSFYLAVDFFFILSGFVLAATLWQAPRLQPFRFLLQRYQRLAPVYLVAVMLSVPVAALWRGTEGPVLNDLVKIVTLGQMLPTGTTSTFFDIEPLRVAWSISAELWVGFALIPLTLALARRARAAAAGFLVIVMLWTMIFLIVRSTDFLDLHIQVTTPELRLGLFRCLMDYSLGLLAYLLWQGLPDCKERDATRLQFGGLALLLCLYAPFTYERRLDFFAPFLFTVLILSLAGRKGRLYRLTSGRTGELLGDISYPLYLIHPLCIFLIVEVLGLPAGNLALLPYLALSLALAFAINRLVERPCMAWFKRKGGQVAPARPAVP